MGRIEELREQLARCMLGDRHRLRRRLDRLGGGRDRQPAALTRLADDLARSVARRRQREARLPSPGFPAELPVSAEREVIASTIEANPVTIVCGETGSGKTTQLPKICLSLGRGVAGMIGHTQPRRVAARSVAARIAEELGTPLGDTVGYQVRFTARFNPDTHVKVMTDGILLAEIQTDRYLEAYDTLIIDEAHERSLNIDFLLGYLRRILPRRPELRVIITSATIDPARFSRHFDDAPIIEVSGRAHPVEVRYRPLAAADEDDRDRDMLSAVVEAVDELAAVGPGDMLVFLPGEREIRETAEALHKHRLPGTELLPLFARLGAADQDRVFRPHGGRRIVLATNVAETSLTVPGIRFVIDPGLARISRYSYRTKVQRLPIEPVSRASAEQRKGRCGRTGPGVCVRLYDEQDFAARPAHPEPEIRRTNLAAVILQMRALRLGAVEDFPFIDPPDRRYVSDGYRLLRELGALDAEDRLTPVGRQLARLPVDPRLGRMVLAAADEGCLREALIIASVLGLPDPRERPMDARQAADAAHEAFRDERSDFLSYLKLWEFHHEQARHLSQNKLRRLLRDRFVSWLRMREWREVHGQLAQLAGDLGLRPNAEPAPGAAIHRALLAGLLGHVGFKGEQREYQGARGMRFQISPGSGVRGSGPKWVMAAELVETRRLYAHTVASIRPEWIERVAGDLARRSHFEPHWDRRRGDVFAYERVTLWGLTVVAKRRVRLAPIDPAMARTVFIQSALVEGRFDTRAGFLAHNLRLVAEIAELESRTRRPDLLVPDAVIHAFYDRRLPAEVHGGASFERWWRRAPGEVRADLELSRGQLLREASVPVSGSAYPDHLNCAGHDYPLAYHFRPGEAGDGVTVSVPVAMLNQLDEAAFDWLVPGMLRAKVIALMRTLPKALRRSFVPLPDFADACLEGLAAARGSLVDALAGELARMTGVQVPEDAWQPARLEPHLRMNFRVLDEQGVTLGEGRDLDALRARFGSRAGEAFAALPNPEFEREGVREWDLGDLPEVVSIERHGMRLSGYPALVDSGDRVDLRLLDTAQKARAAHRAGVRRLLLARAARDARHVRRNLPGIDRMCLVYGTLPFPPWRETGEDGGACEELRSDLLARIADLAFFGDTEPARDASAFASQLREGGPALSRIGADLALITSSILELARQVRSRRRGIGPGVPAHSLADLDSQIVHLVHRGFVATTPVEWLRELPRYLKALVRRMEKVERESGRDASRTREIAPLWAHCVERLAGGESAALQDEAFVHYRWMVEEFRVSVFAQELGTRFPVSAQRLQRQWEKVGG